jgi:hypothetical protein
MVGYVVTQEGNGFAVRLTSISGQVVATFSNKLAAENFAKKQQIKDESAVRASPETEGG